jgi:hypothetical protein
MSVLFQRHLGQLPRKEQNMKKFILKKCLLTMPVIVLFITLVFLSYAVQYFKDTAYTLVYNTNVESVLRFSRELRELSAQGYTSEAYGDLYTHMIQNYSMTLGQKNAIATFLLDENGQIYHSSEHNEEYLYEVLANPDNMTLVNAAFQSQGEGEIELEADGEGLLFYYHRFYSGDDNYTMYMNVHKADIQAELNADGVIIPISVIGLLLLFTIEYTIWLKMESERKKDVDDDAD